MNEWSHQGLYSDFERHQTRKRSSRWEDPWKQRRKMSNNRYKDYQPSNAVGHHYTSEDVCVPPTFSSKKKKHVSGDPRFKRVINTEEEHDKIQKYGRGVENTGKNEKMFSDRVVLNIKSQALHSEGVFHRSFGDQKDINHRVLSDAATKDVGFSIPSKYLEECINNRHFETIREPEKFKTNLERSASDCTLQTKNTYGDDVDEDRIRSYPSATRVHKVYDWMREYKVTPEKKRSVITVIGQTQTKPFSKVLHEINQRRKLAKELDRHALCEAIMQPEYQSEGKDLVAKVDFVLPDGKVLYSAEKVYLCKDSKSNTDHYCGEGFSKRTESLDTRENIRKRCEMIPERDSCFVNKKLRNRRLVKKSFSKERKKQVADVLRAFYSRHSHRLSWCFLLLVCLSFAFYASVHVFKPTKSFFFYDIFQQKPAPWYETWYERLLI